MSKRVLKVVLPLPLRQLGLLRCNLRHKIHEKRNFEKMLLQQKPTWHRQLKMLKTILVKHSRVRSVGELFFSESRALTDEDVIL